MIDKKVLRIKREGIVQEASVKKKKENAKWEIIPTKREVIVDNFSIAKQ